MNDAVVESPGCVVFLIDESAAMESPVQEDVDFAAGQPPKSKAQSVATALNSLLKQLSGGPSFDVALVGYRIDNSGQPVVGSRWGGALAGRDFVPVADVAANPISVESRARRLPDPSSLSGYREETVQFPVWYVPSTGGIAPQVLAFQHCARILTEWLAGAGPNAAPPLVIHVFAGGSGDGNPVKAVGEIQAIRVGTGTPLLFQAQLAASKMVPPTLYPAKRGFLPAGPLRDLFDRCSPLPPTLVSAVRQKQIAADADARGTVYNAKMVDIVQFFSLVKAHTRNWDPQGITSVSAPGPNGADEGAAAVAVEAPVPGASDAAAAAGSRSQLEEQALVVLLLNRSLEDPFAADPKNAWSRLQDQANQILSTIGKGDQGKIEAAVVSYGRDGAGEVEVRTTYDGPLAGQTIVKDCALAAGALRVDEVEQQESNGVGGLMTITVKKKVFVELDPTPPASTQSAFAAVAEIVGSWCAAHPSAGVPPVVVHLTHDTLDADALEASASDLSLVQTQVGTVRLYHLVATEKPHSSVSYPADDEGLQTASLKKIWALSSPLLGGETLAASNPHLVKPNARGVVVNAKFDLLVKGITSGWSS